MFLIKYKNLHQKIQRELRTIEVIQLKWIYFNNAFSSNFWIKTMQKLTRGIDNSATGVTYGNYCIRFSAN